MESFQAPQTLLRSGEGRKEQLEGSQLLEENGEDPTGGGGGGDDRLILLGVLVLLSPF